VKAVVAWTTFPIVGVSGPSGDEVKDPVLAPCVGLLVVVRFLVRERCDQRRAVVTRSVKVRQFRLPRAHDIMSHPSLQKTICEDRGRSVGRAILLASPVAAANRCPKQNAGPRLRGCVTPDRLGRPSIRISPSPYSLHHASVRPRLGAGSPPPETKPRPPAFRFSNHQRLPRGGKKTNAAKHADAALSRGAAAE